jgi:hypothetical protein
MQQLLKLAIILTASALFLGCTSQSPQTQSSPTPSNTPTPDTTTLKAAIKELQMVQTKIKDGINYKGYSDIIAETVPVVQKTKGEAKAVAAVKSAFEGHQLALRLWQCDRLEGYEELHQCRGKALSGIFAKYSDIEAQAKAVVKGKDLSTISAGLDKEELLQRIWEKTNADTKAARQAISEQSSAAHSPS